MRADRGSAGRPDRLGRRSHFPASDCPVVADGFVITYPGGQQRDKAETIASLDPGQPDDTDSRMYTTDDAVTFFGDDIAVIRGTFHFEVTNADGSVQLDSSLYTDVYKHMDGRWRARRPT